MSSCRSSVTSSRSDTVAISYASSSFARAGQLVACAPELREEVVVDQLPEHLDRRPLRADDLVADDARDDLVVADAPDA